ncbi:MAG: hypothetical protein P4L57_10280 [Rhizomicrobium sp.]|nr:hypothetical protein [Rhizomicrobium sp.]
MRICGVLLAATLVFFGGTTVCRAADIIVDPDVSTVFLLQSKFSHTVPHYDTIAEWDPAVRVADEFQKPVAIKQVVAKLRARAASLEGVKQVVVNLRSAFSEFDDQYQEYEFDFDDGTYIPFDSGYGNQVRIALTNGTKARTWKLNPKDAELVLRRNRGLRNVRLVLTLLPLPSPKAVGNDAPVLNAKIIGYDVVSGSSNVKLGSVAVERAL